MPRADFVVRPAVIGDAGEVRRLAEALGYPVEADEMKRRLATLLSDTRHRVFVADDEQQPGLLGWAHVERRISLEGGTRAELMGLIVDRNARGFGVGAALVDEAEQWALAGGVASITVRSNIARDVSHGFYESMRYVRIKTQHVYEKPLKPDGEGEEK